MSEHKWVDVRGWGGARPGTVQCDRCNRVVVTFDPERDKRLASACHPENPAHRPTSTEEK